MVEKFIADSHESPETIDAARSLCQEVFADRDHCDELLARHARHWELVDRNILRLAVHEVRSGKVPYKVAISEAIRLAEEFSTAESSKFINGVLDSIAKELLAED